MSETRMEEGYCLACSGSGEGMHDGTRCYACKGSGSQWYEVESTEINETECEDSMEYGLNEFAQDLGVVLASQPESAVALIDGTTAWIQTDEDGAKYVVGAPINADGTLCLKDTFQWDQSAFDDELIANIKLWLAAPKFFGGVKQATEGAV